jgi:hypothetical protein
MTINIGELEEEAWAEPLTKGVFPIIRVKRTLAIIMKLRNRFKKKSNRARVIYRKR